MELELTLRHETIIKFTDIYNKKGFAEKIENGIYVIIAKKKK